MSMRGKTTLNKWLMQLICVGLLIPLLAASVVNYLQLRSSTLDKAVETHVESAVDLGRNCDLLFQEMVNNANSITFHADVQANLLTALNGGAPNLWALQRTMEVPLSEYWRYSGLMSNVVLFDANGAILTSKEGYRRNVHLSDYSFCRQLLASHGENLWISSHLDAADYNNTGKYVISLVRAIRWKKADSDIGLLIGYLVMNVQEEEIYRQLTLPRVEDRRNLYILNGDGVVVSAADKAMIGRSLDAPDLPGEYGGFFTELGGKRQLITYASIHYADWKLVGLIDQGTLISSVNASFAWTIWSSVGLILLFLALAMLLSRQIVRPVRRLRQHMREVEAGAFPTTVTQGRIQEMSELLTGFNHMTSRLDHLIHEVYEARIKENELEALARSAELKALMQQINPHFLYNTLDAINWEAQFAGQEHISDMITALGDYLHVSVSRDDGDITLEQEIGNIEKYLAIQKMRYGARLNVAFHVDEAYMKQRVMKLMLQPLVENAIIHGIDPKKAPGHIRISAERCGDFVRLAVQDDGVGTDQREIDRILSLPERDAPSIGLKNVAERVRLFYDGRAQFHVLSAPGAGTTVEILIHEEVD